MATSALNITRTNSLINKSSWYFKSTADLDKYVNCKEFIEELRIPKFHNQEKFYEPVYLTYSKVDVPQQSLCKMEFTKSLNKVIDTPIRDTLQESTLFEDDEKIKEISNFFIEPEEELGLSQESTSENGYQKEEWNNASLIPKISIKTSRVFTDWKTTDFENFYKEYRTVTSKMTKNFSFRLVKKTQNNFSVRKVKPPSENNNEKTKINKIFERFDSDVGNFLWENNNDLATEEQPSLIHLKYSMKTSKSNIF